jgi:putative ABC transport system ATP-binding protein
VDDDHTPFPVDWGRQENQPLEEKMLGLIRRKTESSRESRTDQGQHLVDLLQVVKIYESAAGKFTALKGVDLQLDPGEFVSIIGKSGSGKSTLINMVTGIDRPTAGQVRIDGTPVHDLNEEQIALWRGRTVGVIFQFFQLLPTLTAVENVMLPMDFWGMYPPRERPERAMGLLELMGMVDYAHKMPSALSGGQQQSIAIARALANDPPILAADEPTGNLDLKTAESVIQLFESLVEHGKTIMVVTHDKDLAERAQRTVEIADGEIVDEIVRR